MLALPAAGLDVCKLAGQLIFTLMVLRPGQVLLWWRHLWCEIRGDCAICSGFICAVVMFVVCFSQCSSHRGALIIKGLLQSEEKLFTHLHLHESDLKCWPVYCLCKQVWAYPSESVSIRNFQNCTENFHPNSITPSFRHSSNVIVKSVNLNLLLKNKTELYKRRLKLKRVSWYDVRHLCPCPLHGTEQHVLSLKPKQTVVKSGDK